MLRINGQCLKKIENIYYFRERPFNGIAYFAEGGKMLAVEEYKQGLLVGPLDLGYLGSNALSNGMTADALDDGDYGSGPVTLDEKLFTGVGFGIKNDASIESRDCFCNEERVYVDGESVKHYRYSNTGDLILFGENVEPRLAWSYVLNVVDETAGSLSSFMVVDPYSENRVYIDFDDEGLLYSVVLNEIYEQQAARLELWLKQAGQPADWLERVGISSRLKLEGNLINDHALGLLMNNERLGNVEKLRMEKAKASLSVVLEFISRTNAEEVELNHVEIADVSDFASQIIRIKPSISKIIINKMTLT